MFLILLHIHEDRRIEDQLHGPQIKTILAKVFFYISDEIMIYYLRINTSIVYLLEKVICDSLIAAKTIQIV